MPGLLLHVRAQPAAGMRDQVAEHDDPLGGAVGLDGRIGLESRNNSVEIKKAWQTKAAARPPADV